jgi:hypothetical protein
MSRTSRSRALPDPVIVQTWNEGFPTTETRHACRCPCCGKTDEATVITVQALANCQAHWLVMPAGWAMTLGMHFSEIRSLQTGLVRCPACLPKPKRARI